MSVVDLVKVPVVISEICDIFDTTMKKSPDAEELILNLKFKILSKLQCDYEAASTVHEICRKGLPISRLMQTYVDDEDD